MVPSEVLVYSFLTNQLETRTAIFWQNKKWVYETSAVMNRPMMNRPSDETFG